LGWSPARATPPAGLPGRQNWHTALDLLRFQADPEPRETLHGPFLTPRMHQLGAALSKRGGCGGRCAWGSMRGVGHAAWALPVGSTASAAGGVQRLGVSAQALLHQRCAGEAARTEAPADPPGSAAAPIVVPTALSPGHRRARWPGTDPAHLPWVTPPCPAPQREAR